MRFCRHDGLSHSTNLPCPRVESEEPAPTLTTRARQFVESLPPVPPPDWAEWVSPAFAELYAARPDHDGLTVDGEPWPRPALSAEAE